MDKRPAVSESRGESYEIIAAAFPEVIPFPRIDRPHRASAGLLSEVACAQDLPSRLLFGDLIDDSFTGGQGDWSVRYGDGHGNSVTLSVQGKQFTAEPVFLGSSGLSVGPADRPQAFAQLLSFGGAQWDRALKAHVEGRYPVVVADSDQDVPTVLYLPDGWLRTLLLPVAPEALPALLEWHRALRGDLDIAAGILGEVRLAGNVLNYVEGRCDALGVGGEGPVIVRSLTTMNTPLVQQVVREEASDGSAAWTLRRRAYVFLCTAFLRDVPVLLAKLAAAGLLRDDPDFTAAIVPAEQVVQASHLTWWSPDRSCRSTWFGLEGAPATLLAEPAAGDDATIDGIAAALAAARRHADWFGLDAAITEVRSQAQKEA